MLLVGYIGYGVLVFALAVALGKFFSSLSGRNDPHYASVQFVITIALVVGIPCVLVGVYLHSRGQGKIIILIFVVASALGLTRGLRSPRR